MQKALFIFVFLIFSLSLKAQTGNVWTFATNTGLDFNYDPPKTIESRIENMSCGSVCDSLGKLLFYTDGINIWNNDNNLIDSFYSKYDYDKFTLGARCATILPTKKLNEFLIIQGVLYQNKPQPFVQKVVSSLYRFNPLTKSGTFVYKNDFVDTLMITFSIKQSNKPGIMYEIFGWHFFGNDIMIYEVDTNNNLTFKKTIPLFRNGLGIQIESINSIAHHSDYLFIAYKSWVHGNTIDHEDSIFFDFYSYDKNYDINLLNRIGRKVGNAAHLLFKDSLIIDISEIAHAAFSPNDSLLYFKGYVNFGNSAKQREGIVQWNVFNSTEYNFFQSPYFNPKYQLGQGFKLGPNGKIYSIPRAIPFVSVINNPDIKGVGCNIQFNALSVANSWNNGLTSTNFFPTTFFIYQRVQFDYKNTCNGIAFYNRSDTGIFKTFTWYFNDSDSIIQTLPHTQRWGNTPATMYDFKTKGTYLVKIKGTKNSGYNVWWSNEVNFTPLKPHAKFSTQSAQGCQYIAYQFNDSSATDTTGSAGYSYFWDYGDGTKEEIKNVQSKINYVKHTYNSSGTYTVRLIFSNGLCSDTFSIVNNVVILPAPKPGFTLGNHSGCTPFNLHLTDTLKSNLVSKEYDFGNGFIAIKSNAILDTTLQLLSPGTYIIKQRLTGTTGCVTEFSDSVKIFSGITTNDTVKVYSTTVLDSTLTKTTWKPLPNAVSYLINNVNLRDTFYIDNTVSPNLQSIKYFIRAIDTCGNQGALSEVAQTILLKAENQNFNEFTLLEFTPYEKWQQGVYQYEIEYFNQVSQSWQNINTIPNNLFKLKVPVLPDSTTSNITSSQICYRVKAIEKNGNQQQSTSNMVCVPVYPVVYIPNAFSPNGDGINDYYKPIAAGLNEYIFEIYDRWGQLIYTDAPDSKGWDGTFIGKALPIGSYIYRLSAAAFLVSPSTNAARRVEKKGILTLVR